MGVSGSALNEGSGMAMDKIGTGTARNPLASPNSSAATASTGLGRVLGGARSAGRSEESASIAQSVVEEEIKGFGGEATACRENVGDWQASKRIIDTTVTTYGGLDAVVNNAGKTVTTTSGPSRFSVPRDRKSEFEPQIVAKGQRRAG
jgi:NAD(P)-dependent dehydrogenase (short-subunit alcohol dehydrogenase family)